MAAKRYITVEEASERTLLRLLTDTQVLDGGVVVDTGAQTTSFREHLVCAEHKTPLEAGVDLRAYHYRCSEHKQGCPTTVIYPASVARRTGF